MKLKFEPVRVEDGKLYFDFSKGFRTKIFARSFAILLGKNQWNSKGFGVLKVLGMLEKEPPIDPFYTVRGEVAEYFAYLYMSNMYQSRNIQDFKFHFTNHVAFDLYEGNKFVGGKYDFKVTFGDTAIIHEVKSKDLDKYSGYVEDESEVLQGSLYSVLENTPKLIMVYMFPSDKVVESIKAWLSNKFNKVENFVVRDFNSEYGLTIDDFKFIMKAHKVDIDETKKLVNQAYATVNQVLKQGYVEMSWFNQYELEAFGEQITPF